MSVKIVLIEDDKVIREAYKFFIEEHHDYTVVGMFPSIETALLKLKELDPHVIFLDIELLGMSGVEGVSKIKEVVDDVNIIMLSVYDNPDYVFTALANGAAGYLTKDASPEKITAAIGEVILGGGPMTSNIARMLVTSFQKNKETPLTKRETEILAYLSEGKTRSMIAQELFIDAETVKSHVKNIYAKLDVHSKADAIQKAKQNKYI
jgi:DNA-binding NarL/FixJ family response regulator